VKLADFNDLCHREYANDRGIVTRLTLSPQECAELSADVISGADRDQIVFSTLGGDVLDPRTTALIAGARVTEIINPATTGNPHPVPVSVGFVTMTPDDGSFSGSAEVTRWVQIAP
jgi:hypothetical protein